MSFSYWQQTGAYKNMYLIRSAVKEMNIAVNAAVTTTDMQ